MEEFPGERIGTTVFIYDGYVYYKDKRTKGIFRCSSRRSLECYAVLKRNPDDTCILKSPHNHPASDTALQQVEMKQEMLRMCRETLMKPKEIFDTVCQRYPVAATKMSYVVMRSLLNREQLRRRPETPQTIVELDLLLINYQPVQYIFKGTVVSDEGYRAVIFTSDALLDALVKSKEIYMDGTFSVVPRVPSFAQLYTIHIRYMDTGIAVLFALCEKRTMNVYNAIWRKLKELRPDALQEVRSVMSDYERAAMTVAREIFPNSRLTGCWFHFNQAVLRRWRALGLTAAPRKILGLTMALPLAPVNMFDQGLQIIQEEADMISAEYPAVLQFTVYLRRTWLPLKDKISTFGTSIQTNNLVESFHYVISRKLGGIHPNIWNFLHNLSDLITDQEINIVRLAEGLSVKRVRVRQNAVRDKRIAEAQSLLNSGRYSLKEFLLALSNAAHLPKENIDLQNIYDTDNQEMADGNLFDAHTVEQFAPISHAENQQNVIRTTDEISNGHRFSRNNFANAASEDIRTLSQNAGLAGRGRSRGRPPSRRGRRGRLASTSNQNQIREETESRCRFPHSKCVQATERRGKKYRLRRSGLAV
ncbi:uncharacterized protein [Temnothorax nylanderi]|uniref:uncharacterized protein n=1 Tax=Temnothorax nylanderi TaxID=102681 RepID=UPI003A84CB73